MRRCEDCQIILDSTVRFCPKCGKQVGEDGAHGRQDVGGLLASANLNRIRQNWDAAVADATEALKLEPKNADTASLLADIYEQRGMLEDALIWCQMSLEVSPQSPAEIERQERLQKQIRGEAGSRPDSYTAFQKQMKIGVMVTAGILLVVAVFAAIIWGDRDRNPARGTLDNPVQRQAYDRPAGISPGPVTPSSASGRGQNSPTMPLVGQSVPVQPGARTPGEAKVKTDLQSVQGSHLQIDDAIADPRHGVLVVTFAVPGSTLTRDNVLASAAGIARAAFVSSPEINYVTARCLAASSDPTLTRIAFVGDISRTASDALGANPAPQALTTAFTSQWWNPQMR